MNDYEYNPQVIPKDDREGRLPKWAQTHIDRLRRQVANAQATATAAQLATAPAESHAILNPYADAPIGLGKHPLVHFTVPYGKNDRGYIGVRRAEGELSKALPEGILVSGYGGLIVKPSSGNAIYVLPDPGY